MKQEDINFWNDVSYKIVREAEKATEPLIGKKEGNKIVKMGADGTPTRLIDIVAENEVVNVLKSVGRPLTLISEEVGEIQIGTGSPEAILVIDPLDGTSNAVKNIPAYGISVAVADSKNHTSNIQDVEIGVVKNFATGDIYSAVKGGGAKINGNDIPTLDDLDVSQSSIGAYIYRADMDKIDKLCKLVRRMRILGSVAIELCYVADGTYDAFVDIRGNLRIVDVVAAKLVIEESGGIITDEKCKPLSGELNVLNRTSVVAASKKKVHREIMSIVGEC